MSAQSMKPGWKMVKFGDVVKNANLVERDLEASGIERIVGLDHLDPENLHVRRWNSPENGTSFSRKFVSGQTLFGKRRAYQRKVAFAEFEGICSGDILTFEPKDKKALLTELLPFICQSDAFFDHALGTSAGSLSPRTSWKALKGFEFPLPPIKEQKRIAEILWAADEAVEKYEIARKKADVLLESIRNHQICSRDHEWKRLGEVLSTIVAGKSVLGVNTPAGTDEYGVLKVSAVGPNGFDPTENKRLISQSDFLPQYKIKKNSLLITRCNTTELVGRVCLTHKEGRNLMLCDKTLELVLDENKVSKPFIFEALHSRFLRTQIMGLSTGTGGAMKNISQKDIRSLSVPIPALSDQENIANKALSVRARVKQIEEEIDSLKNVAELLSNDMIWKNGAAHV
jgi:type I restriction enzyme S subunit